ncbi:hypothetical protein DXC81_08190 [Collinsella tanakaei]|uniref:Uncharacterized protein n=1 Tax=Collinsella tanakaei TaxID=626935 RepID=A0A3E4QR06_9ACTN|nr:hypothetical protein [Collinsella tanakaei]RGL09562.1 hypothetical protein DXC81_08190 [Collinsella tanakaei]
MSNFIYDEHTGILLSSFTVSVEGDDLVFRVEDGAARSTSARKAEVDGISERIDAGEFTIPFAGIVKAREGDRFADSKCVPGYRVPRGAGDQYRVDMEESGKELLHIAGLVGPLFGNYGEQPDGSSEIREPIAWWADAAGAFRLALRLRELADGRGNPSVLDDEVVFLQVSELRRRAAGAHREAMLAAIYARDEPFPAPYERLLTVDRASRPRVFPVTGGRGSDGNTYVRADYCRLGEEADEADSIAVSSSKHPKPMPFRNYSGGAIDDVRCLAEAVRSKAAEVEPKWGWACSKAIFGYRVHTRLPERTPGSMSPSTLMGEIAGDEGVAFLMGNAFPSMSWLGLAEPLYEDLYDALVSLHTWRCSADYRKGVAAFPFYTCALEHLWTAMARIGSAAEVGFCEYCGKPFKKKAGRKYCGEFCRERGKDRRKAERNRRIDAQLRSYALMRPRKPFTAKDLLKDMGADDIKVEEVLTRLEGLARGGSDGSRRYRVEPLGGNAIGKRFCVVPWPRR